MHIIIKRLLPNGMVMMALCTCTARLSGCCNNVVALLVAVLLSAFKEFVRFGLQDEEESPSSKLCKWNRPCPQKTKPKKDVDVWLVKASFGKKSKHEPSDIIQSYACQQRLAETSEQEQFRSFDPLISTPHSPPMQNGSAAQYATASLWGSWGNPFRFRSV